VLLRKRHEHLQGLGVKTLAISVDHLPALRVFDSAAAQFPFPLAADWHRGICRHYGVLDEEKQAARRVLTLVDKQSVIRHVVMDFTPEQTDQLDGLMNVAATLQSSWT
jgi:alkyl hydroperoxide reductase subunit AhpC